MESVPTRVEFPEENEGKNVRIQQLAAGYKHMMAIAGKEQTDRVLYTCKSTTISAQQNDTAASSTQQSREAER